MNRSWNLNPALAVSTSWSSAYGRLQITPAGDGVLVYWGGSTNELSDTLYYDTEIEGYTNRQSAADHLPLECPKGAHDAPRPLGLAAGYWLLAAETLPTR